MFFACLLLCLCFIFSKPLYLVCITGILFIFSLSFYLVSLFFCTIPCIASNYVAMCILDYNVAYFKYCLICFFHIWWVFLVQALWFWVWEGRRDQLLLWYFFYTKDFKSPTGQLWCYVVYNSCLSWLSGFVWLLVKDFYFVMEVEFTLYWASDFNIDK